MANLPLTKTEKELIKQIDKEVQKLCKEMEEVFEVMTKTSNAKEQERLLEKGQQKSRAIRIRCRVREDIFRVGMDRLAR
jgi:ElaB/YqjD/DUF883 family membrane-anchored ribosome-binding protein